MDSIILSANQSFVQHSGPVSRFEFTRPATKALPKITPIQRLSVTVVFSCRRRPRHKKLRRGMATESRPIQRLDGVLAKTNAAIASIKLLLTYK